MIIEMTSSLIMNMNGYKNHILEIPGENTPMQGHKLQFKLNSSQGEIRGQKISYKVLCYVFFYIINIAIHLHITHKPS